MTFSNPAGTAAAVASTCVRALLDLLGPRDPVTVMRELLPWLGDRLRSIPEATLRRMKVG